MLPSVKKIAIVSLYFIVFWIIVPGLLFLFSFWLDRTIFSAEQLSRAFIIPGIIIFVPGISLFFTSVYQFRKFSGNWPVSALPPGKIIEKGLFSVVRHPIYFFALIAIAGAGLMLQSKGFVLVVLPAFIFVLVIYIFMEERNLLKRLGAHYQLYKKRVPLFWPRFHNWIRILAWPVFTLVFKLKIINKSNVPGNSPFFVVSSHRNYLDPFFISFALPFQVKHVCTFEMFRKPVTARILKWFGAIPKKRYKNDGYSTRQIIQAINEGYCVGIFPEGGRSWTGEMRSLKKESLKLVRRFHSVPILPVRVEGNYHAWPRWSDRVLKASVSIIFEQPVFLQGKETLEEIENLLVKRIRPRLQNESRSSCRNDFVHSKFPVVLYRCPECRSHSALENSIPNTLVCRNCKTEFSISKHFDIRSAKNGAETKTIQQLYERIKINEDDLNVTFNNDTEATHDSVLYQSVGKLFVERDLRFEELLEGAIQLSPNFITAGNGNKGWKFELAKIDAVTIESNCKLQVYSNAEGQLYQLLFPNESALKWQDFIELILVQRFHKQPITR